MMPIVPEITPTCCEQWRPCACTEHGVVTQYQNTSICGSIYDCLCVSHLSRVVSNAGRAKGWTINVRFLGRAGIFSSLLCSNSQGPSHPPTQWVAVVVSSCRAPRA